MADPSHAARQRSPIIAHAIEFSGNGREFFRIWIVNLLLKMVTLGIYTPWARRRKVQYFYAHTNVAGDPLEFQVNIKRMVRGFLILAAFYLLYKLASYTGQETVVLCMTIAFALLVPWLWGNAMRFRLRATRWRGIRLAFTASWREIYAASWAVFVLAGGWIALFLIGVALVGAIAPEQGLGKGRGALTVLLVLPGLVLAIYCLGRLEYNYKRLLVLRANVGGQRGVWRVRPGVFTRIWFASAGMTVLTYVVTALVFFVAGAFFSQPYSHGIGLMILFSILSLLISVIALLLGLWVGAAYHQARSFQVVWNNVGVGKLARFRCTLSTPAYMRLRIKNILLTLLTLGFYRPFALASEYAMRANSVRLYLKGNTDALAGQMIEEQGALGDAVADVLGLDIIG